MCKDRAISLSVSFVMLAICCSTGTHAEDGAIVLSTHSAAIQGGPLVVKISCTGPQRISPVDLRSAQNHVVVTLREEETKKEYLLECDDEENGIVIPGEGPTSYSFVPYIELGNGDRRDMIFNLADLSARSDKTRTNLDKVPPGTYKMSLRFKGLNVISNEVELKLIGPSEKDASFLDGIKRSKFVGWTHFLQNERIVALDISGASQTLKQQMSFLLLLRSITTAISLTDGESKISSIATPAFLEPERTCLQLEAEYWQKKKEERDLIVFIEKFPGLKWRIDDIIKGGKDLLFLRFIKNSGLEKKQ